MTTRRFVDILQKHRFFSEMKPEYVEVLAGCARNERFPAGHQLFEQGADAEFFYLVRAGRVAVQLQTPAHGRITVETVDEGDVLGWSWLFPPYVWNFDAVAIEDTRVLELDARCMRGKCEQAPEMGYEMMKRFSSIVVLRLQAQRIQLLDMFNA